MDSRKQLEQIVERFGKLRIAILGDVVADLYITGQSDRVSREAPIIVIRQTSEELIPGCAANVAVNVASLGVRVDLLGLVGRDARARELKATLRKAGVSPDGLIAERDYQTVVKTRVMAGATHTAPQQVLRIDREPQSPPPAKVERAILAKVKTIDPKVDAWLLSDYGYKVITPAIRERFEQIARAKPVLADSRYGIVDYKHLTAIKPNEQEALDAAGIREASEDVPIGAAGKLQRRTRAKVVMITLGNKGMLVYRSRRDHKVIPAFGGDQIVDLTGAGDTAGAALITALAAGADVYAAAMIANAAGSVVVMKQGCASCSRQELMQTMERYLLDE